jgi:hypothetical protein
MNIEESKNAILANGKTISESVKFLFKEYTGKSDLNTEDFESRLNNIFRQFNIPITFKVLIGNGNVDIHPADDQSKQLVQFCQENNII